MNDYALLHILTIDYDLDKNNRFRLESELDKMRDNPGYRMSSEMRQFAEALYEQLTGRMA